MKIIAYFLLLLSISIIASYSAFAQQDRWSYVGKDTSGALFYLDKTSRKSVGNIIKVWDKIVYTDGSYRISQTEWKCSEKKFFIVDVTIYSPTSSFIGKDKTIAWLNVVPDSISEAMLKAVCGNLSNKNSEKTSSSIKMAEITAGKANVRAEPDINSTIIKKVKSGERFGLIDENPTDGWYQIIISGMNKTGWIHGNTIKLVEITNRPLAKFKDF